VERLAILPLENLGSDVFGDWAGRAAAAAIVYDLAGAKRVYAQTLDSLAAAESMQASLAFEGYFLARNGRLEIRATVEDLRTSRTMQSLSLSGPVAEGFVPLVNQLSRALSPEARPFGTNSPDAFRLWGEALASNDRQKTLDGLAAARQADPGFTLAGFDLAQVLAASGDRDKARQAIAAAEGGHPGPIERARLESTSASLSGDGNARLQALAALAKNTPANANVFLDLAQLRLFQHDFEGAVRDYRESARLNPSDPRVWNELGYALADTQDLAGARGALEQYRKLTDGSANALDSLGEVSFLLGDFTSAVRYFLEASGKNPAELAKAAEARLMMGDLAAADALMQRYLNLPHGGQSAHAAYQQAQWEYLTGRRSSGFAHVGKVVPQLDADAGSRALSQLSIWKLEMGDAKAAADLANQAVTRAISPQARNLGALCRFLSLGSGSSSGSRPADAYARLFARKYAEAVPLLEEVYRQTNPGADGQIRTLLAWAYVETGRIADAARLLRLYPIPLSSGEPLFASLIFPRYLFLRGLVLEKEGKPDEAKKNYALYLKYAGDVPDVFGDEAKARHNLGATN
jgi:Flp pilus assembly protein TadD